LAVEFVEHGWSLKHLHRLMVTSAAYCQGSFVDPSNPRHAKALTIDRENKLLWHARRQRLEGEALHDAMLQFTGELNPRPFGPSARPKLPDGISSYAWTPDARPDDQHRRSIYVFAKRNMRYPLFDVFDLPDMHNSCACRNRTTTAPQALLLLNSDFVLERAQSWAEQLLGRFGNHDAGLVVDALRSAWGRTPSQEEIEAAQWFVRRQTEVIRQRASQSSEVPSFGRGGIDAAQTAAVRDLCHAILNANEFVYVD
jgi:hypothetical protein